jgi:hypothetical protein
MIVWIWDVPGTPLAGTGVAGTADRALLSAEAFMHTAQARAGRVEKAVIDVGRTLTTHHIPAGYGWTALRTDGQVAWTPFACPAVPAPPTTAPPSRHEPGRNPSMSYQEPDPVPDVPADATAPHELAIAAIRLLPVTEARMMAVEILLAEPRALNDDVLESSLYLLRERLRAA